MSKMRKKSNQTNFISNNSGSTMTEVLVGFVLLMILVATLVNIVKVSQNMIMNSTDYINRREAFAKERYQKTAAYEEVAGVTFSLEIDNGQNKTSPLNQAVPIDLTLDLKLEEYQSTQDIEMSMYRFKRK